MRVHAVGRGVLEEAKAVEATPVLLHEANVGHPQRVAALPTATSTATVTTTALVPTATVGRARARGLTPHSAVAIQAVVAVAVEVLVVAGLDLLPLLGLLLLRPRLLLLVRVLVRGESIQRGIDRRTQISGNLKFLVDT